MGAWLRVAVGFVVGVVIAGGILLAADDDDAGPGGMRITEEGLVFEPAANVGPDAFTPPVDTDDDQVCDKERFVEELQARPDALREWSRVLGMAEDQVPAYVDTLQPIVLTSDTPVTNHGLRNGQAYARPSLLQKGTAVLVDPTFPGLIPLPTTTTTPGLQTVPTTTTTTTAQPTTTTTTADTTTTLVEGGTPVTRCKCGNPLLPPYKGAMGVETTTTTEGEPTTTTRPRDRATTTTRAQPTSTTTTTTTPVGQATTTTRRTTTTTSVTQSDTPVNQPG